MVFPRTLTLNVSNTVVTSHGTLSGFQLSRKDRHYPPSNPPLFHRSTTKEIKYSPIFFSLFKLLISVIVLRSLLSSTKAPVNRTIMKYEPTSVTPTIKTATTGLDVGAKSVVTPSTWVDIRLVTRKGINLIMFANGTVAGTWSQSLTAELGRFIEGLVLQLSHDSIVKDNFAINMSLYFI